MKSSFLMATKNDENDGHTYGGVLHCQSCVIPQEVPVFVLQVSDTLSFSRHAYQVSVEDHYLIRILVFLVGTAKKVFFVLELA